MISLLKSSYVTFTIYVTTVLAQLCYQPLKNLSRTTSSKRVDHYNYDEKKKEVRFIVAREGVTFPNAFKESISNEERRDLTVGVAKSLITTVGGLSSAAQWDCIIAVATEGRY